MSINFPDSPSTNDTFTANSVLYTFDGVKWVATPDAQYVRKTGSTGAAIVPSGTTAQRDSAPTSGYFRFNSDTTSFEGYDGTAWGSIGGGATGESGDEVFFLNDQEVSANYTVPSGKNAMTAGPITVNNGIEVTVSSGSTWVVV